MSAFSESDIYDLLLLQAEDYVLPEGTYIHFANLDHGVASSSTVTIHPIRI